MFGVFATRGQDIRSARFFRASQYKRHKITRRLGGLFAVGGLVVSSVLLPLSYALPGDYHWKNASLVGDQMSWGDVVSSADGTRLATFGNAGGSPGGYIYTSADSGTTWTQRMSAGFRTWSALASSADGTKLVAAVNDWGIGGYIYTSTDSGATWTERTSAGFHYWESIASSADGTKLAAVTGGYWTAGYIYTSTDSGVTWSEQTSAGVNEWTSIASSADGTKLAAVAYTSGIFTSLDSGVTWTEDAGTAAMSINWESVTMSADGTKLAAAPRTWTASIYVSTDSGATWADRTVAVSQNWTSVAYSSDGNRISIVADDYDNAGASTGRYVYTSSDAGVTWTEQTAGGLRHWQSIASSADGSKLVANAWLGSMYRSADSGATWTELTVAGSRQWQSIASSADGTKLVAVSGGYDSTGYVYTSTDSGTTWTEQSSSGPRHWQFIASSADGNKLVATEYYFDSNIGDPVGYIYTSTDSGVTWVKQVGIASQYWQSVASSADGTKLVAVENHYDDAIGGTAGSIYTSSDSGVTWTEQTGAGLHEWSAVASSSTGNNLVATVRNGAIYTSSDSGVTWTEQTGAGVHQWSTVASSSTGSNLAAAYADYDGMNHTYSGSIYTSNDSGVTWIERILPDSRAWASLASSSDGAKLAAVAVGGLLYNSKDFGATWTEQASLGANNWDSTAISSDGSKVVATALGGNIYLANTEGPTTVKHSYSSNTAPIDAEPAVARSALSVTSSTCYVIASNSTAILGATSLTAPQQHVTLLGGIAYNMSCAIQGGSTDATVTLGEYYPDTSKLRIYKKSTSSSVLVDITNQVSIANTIDASNAPITTLRYTLVDGGDYDEDGMVNGVIVDPLYVGVVETASATWALAETGGNMWTIALAGICMTMAGAWLAIKRTA